MEPERWERIQAIFHAALARPAAKRADFVRVECGADAALVEAVLAMLEEDARASVLERGVAAVASRVLDGSVPHLERIGPYRIVDVAGRGGMGVVYLAERDDLGTRAAIKVLRDATLSPMRRERFASEQRVLARLDHPFIGRLFDADTLADGTPYFVMEWVDGVSLTEHARARQLTVRQRLTLFRDVCQGVRYAHAAAVIHRDLKPSNILVRRDGVVKLLDFGIAKQLETVTGVADGTRTELRLMTPAYAAPEQLVGEPVGTFTDVYALGVVLYELLTGRLPFDTSALTPGQLERAILEQEPERLSRAVPGSAGAPPDAPRLGASAWADLDILCRTAMHRDPDRRYRTVDALERDVQRFLARQPLEARGDSIGYRVDRFLRRNARAVAGVAMGVAALVAVSVFYAASLTAARDQAVLEASRAQQTQEFLLELFRGGDATLGPTDTLRVVSLLERGQSEARLLGNQPGLQAALFATLGEIYHQLGDLPRADSLLELALERRRALFGPEHPDVAASLIALGRLRVDQVRVDEGEQLIRAGLDMTRSLRPVDAHQAAAAAALGDVLRDRGAYEEAMDVLTAAIRGYGSEPTPARARAILSLAGTYFYAGRYEVSDSLNRQALALYHEMHGPRHPRVADVLINLGAIRFEQGRYGDAEAHYRQALEIKLESFGEDHHQIAANRTMLGRALVAQQRFDDALAELEPALRVRERVFGPRHPSVAASLNEVGTIFLQLGDLTAAEENYGRMLAIYDEVYDGRHAFSGIALSNLASVHVQAGNLVRAEEMLVRAVDQFTTTLGPEHSNTAIALIKLGGVVRRQERWQEAVEPLRAGYDTLSPLADPGAAFLQTARRDLAEVYRALGDAEKADRWWAEYTAHAEGAGP